MSRAVLVLIGGFGLLQAAVVLSGVNGPFVDEGIYATSGARLLRGLASDHSWLGGSVFLFPALSGAAYLVGGIAGSRLLTVALYCVALLLFERFARNFVGRAAALWGLVLICVNGILFSMAHLAVYDALSFLGLCGSLALFSSLVERPFVHRALLLGACCALTVMAKYFAIVPLSGILWLYVAGRRPPLACLGIALATCAALLIFWHRGLHGQWLPVSAVRALADQDLYTRGDIIFQWVYFAGLPVLLALMGARYAHRDLAGACFFSACIWPALHLIAGSQVSLNKHVAYGFVYLYPLAGLGLSALVNQCSRWTGVVLTGTVLAGIFQGYVQDRTWADIRPLARLLKAHLRSEDTVAFEWSWSLALYTAVDGPLASHTAILDKIGLHSLRLSHEDPCKLDWIIVTEGPGIPMNTFAETVRRCSFVQVRTLPAHVWYVLPFYPRTGQWSFAVYHRPSAALQARVVVDGAEAPALTIGAAAPLEQPLAADEENAL